MAITMKKYVDITSGVGGGAAVAARQLIARFYTKNTALAVDELFETSDLSAVMAKFGQASEEYRRAQAYFSFISKMTKKPPAVAFARWDVLSYFPPVLTGDSAVKDPTTIASALGNAAKITIQTGNNAAVTTAAIDCSAINNITGLLTAVQAAIRTAGAAQPALANITLTYNSASNRVIVSNALGASGTANDIGLYKTTAQSGGTKDIAAWLGLLLPNTDLNSVAGRIGNTAVQQLDRSTYSGPNASDNYGSFAFIGQLPLWNSALPADQGNRTVDIAAWNHAENNKFLFSHYVTLAAASAAWFDAHKGFSGTAFTLTQDQGANPTIDAVDFQAQSPMEILASTDYLAINGTQGYMFYQFDTRAPLVTDTPTSDAADAYRLNYIGQTQTAGQKINFYQRGLLMGGSTAAVDMNTYANEMWMKDSFLSNIMSLLLSMPKVSANEIGRGLMLGIMQDTVNLGLRNGSISTGKALNATQRAFITQMTGDPKAWFQVQNTGYWLDADIRSAVNPTTKLTEYSFNYTFIYSKDDLIRKVTGSDTLI